MAVTKDYYRILNVRSSASATDIKNAYRKLAMKYHPDRNPGDALSAAVFSDVAEAYSILSDVDARKVYNESRYTIAEKEYKRPLETIENLIQRISKINEQLKHINPFHFNRDALLYALVQLFPDDVDLLAYTNKNQLQVFLEKIIHAAKYLSSHQTKQLIALLEPLTGKNEWLEQNLQEVLKQQQKTERWDKTKVFLVAVAVIILCIIIFLVASK